MLEIEDLSLPPRIDAISLKLSKGKIYGIIGPNGSGKTTFFKTLKRIEKPTRGKVLLNNEDLTTISYKELSTKLALVPQNPQINFSFSVREFIEMGRYGIGAPNEPLLEALLSKLELTHFAKAPLTALSGGEKQRAYLARSLMTEAPFLLLDEPMGTLLARHHRALKKLKRLIEEGSTEE